jgi:hypothetical protein
MFGRIDLLQTRYLLTEKANHPEQRNTKHSALALHIINWTYIPFGLISKMPPVLSKRRHGLCSRPRNRCDLPYRKRRRRRQKKHWTKKWILRRPLKGAYILFGQVFFWELKHFPLKIESKKLLVYLYTIRKCSSSAFQSMVLSVDFDNLWMFWAISMSCPRWQKSCPSVLIKG